MRYLLITIFIVCISFTSVNAQTTEPQNKLIHDSFITVLRPITKKAIYEHYRKFHVNQDVQIDLSRTEIISIQRLNGDYSFLVKEQVSTYVGHPNVLPRGLETITFRIDPSGRIQIVSYKHNNENNLGF